MTKYSSRRWRIGTVLVATAALGAGAAAPVYADHDEVPADLPKADQLLDTAHQTSGFTGKWFVELSADPVLAGGSSTTISKQQQTFDRQVSDDEVEIQNSFDQTWNGLTVTATAEGLDEITKASNVTGVYPVLVVERPDETPDFTASPDMFSARDLTGASVAQNELGLTGQGVKIGIIDSGIDYDNTVFGGTGVSGESTFPTPKVVAGYDFVGDSFNSDTSDANYDPTPQPDEDPDDCGGHGTHVAGIAAGDDTASELKGVAPDALLGAYRVFGCDGSTDSDIMLQAMERAAKDGMDVVNMSIGASFQTWPNYPTAVAANNMADAGIVVTVSQGNSGERGIFSGGAPSVASKVISVGSVDNTFITLPSFQAADGQVYGYLSASNAPTAPKSGTFELAVYPDGQKTGAVSIGDDSFTGKAVLVSRGTSTFYDKAAAAQADGAAAVIIYNNQAGTINATVAGDPPITIPVVTITQEQGAALEALAAAGDASITWTDQTTASEDPAGGQISSFSSYGLAADLTLKPDVLAPGGNIYSAYPLDAPDGDGSGFATLGGTSMAAPHTAGAAALVLQANPAVSPDQVRTVLQNTANPLELADNTGVVEAKEAIHRQGAGLIDVPDAVAAVTSNRGAGVKSLPSTITPSKISLGDSDSNEPTTLTITNRSDEEVVYTLSADTTPAGTWGPNRYFFSLVGFDPQVTFSADTVTVPAGATRTVEVTIDEPTHFASTATGAQYDLPAGAIYGGYVVLSGSDNTVRQVPFAGLKGDYETDLEFLHSTWTYGDVYSSATLAQAGIPEDRLLFQQPTLARLTACPNGLFFGQECMDSDAEYRLEDADAVYTMADGDVPIVALHLENPVSMFDIQAYHANADGSKGDPVSEYGSVYHSDGAGANSGTAMYLWDGTYYDSANTDTALDVPDGRYILEVTVTKGLGQAQNGENNETWTSPAFVVRSDPNAEPTDQPEPAEPRATLMNSWDSDASTLVGPLAAGVVLVGDWDGDGVDTFMFRNGNKFAYSDGFDTAGGTSSDGLTSSSFHYGRVGDEVLVGDWDGDGKDTLAVRRGNTFYIANTLAGGNADTTFTFGRSGDEVLVGDWDGDGKDTLAVRRGNVFFVNNTLRAGAAETSFAYGRSADALLVGDWDGDGKDTFAVRRGDTYFLTNSLRGGNADATYTVGSATGTVAVGDWDGDGVDTLVLLP
ncbi:S8 family serine peptidase [Actinobaculum sp. 352]|uniref:S8 family serine peptidase n=1 Tax=Actinobaculum sp. 352 TaxID=2490946 RepID=UPI000F7E2F91|nr:S8 family serine peptidase [Actinobaculum sp. 352]RTE50909.1 peptidase S8 [Actinobaculum sp. 352]